MSDTKSEAREEELRLKLLEILGQLSGYSSMCWSETPAGVFDSNRAQTATNEAIDNIMPLIEAAERRGMDRLIDALPDGGPMDTERKCWLREIADRIEREGEK